MGGAVDYLVPNLQFYTVGRQELISRQTDSIGLPYNFIFTFLQEI